MRGYSVPCQLVFWGKGSKGSTVDARTKATALVVPLVLVGSVSLSLVRSVPVVDLVLVVGVEPLHLFFESWDWFIGMGFRNVCFGNIALEGVDVVVVISR